MKIYIYNIYIYIYRIQNIYIYLFIIFFYTSLLSLSESITEMVVFLILPFNNFLTCGIRGEKRKRKEKYEEDAQTQKIKEIKKKKKEEERRRRKKEEEEEEEI